jgi:uncharacterized protein YkwD
MKLLRSSAAVCLAVVASVALAQSPATPDSQSERPSSVPIPAWQFFQQANEGRVQAGLAPMRWDPALAASAKGHCLLMVLEGERSPRFNHEATLEDRAWQAGARFSFIQEDMAIAANAAEIQGKWQGIRGDAARWLDPRMDSFGMAIETSHGTVYAVADYAQSASFLTLEQVEAQVARLLRAQGLIVVQTNGDARTLCSGGTMVNYKPSLVMSLQAQDLAQLPDSVLKILPNAHFRKAAVGSCWHHDSGDQYGMYNVELLFYLEGTGLY